MHLIPETPHDIMTQFAAEDAERLIRIDVEKQLQQMSIPSDAENVTIEKGDAEQ
jgi:hypothetical protein